MVHGNIISENIEVKIKQNVDRCDTITDVRIVNYEYSYKYGKNKHTYYDLDRHFANKSLPPEMVFNLKCHYTNLEKKIMKLKDLE